MPAPLLFLKAHIPGYTRKDGSVVHTHETKAAAAHKPAPAPTKAKTAQWPGWDSKAPLDFDPPEQGALFPAGPKPPAVTGAQFGGKLVAAENKKWSGGQSSLFGGSKAPPSYPGAVAHAQPGLNGKPFQINVPSVPSMEHTWADPGASAVFVPDGDTPAELNGIAFAPWAGAPTSIDQWQDVDGQMVDLVEPDMITNGKKPSAGVVIEEADGRIWLVNPTNGFGDYTTTFPKGRADDGISFQATAIKEAFEESGLQVEIIGLIGDVERSQTMTRYYRARRVGGTPAAMGWETQAVQLVPAAGVHAAVNKDIDRQVAELAGIST